MILEIFDSFGIKSARTKNIAKHIGMSFFFKSGSVIASLLLVPVTINYLNTENYGIWLTVSSFIAWFSFFDIGLGHGLRNKFAESRINGDDELSRAYISSAYYTVTSLSLILFISFLGINFFINWAKFFNTDPNLNTDLFLLMPVIFGFFCLQLIVSLITSIYLADQIHSTQIRIQFITNVTSLILIWLISMTGNGSLLIFGIIFSALPFLILLVFNFLAFSGRYRYLRPTISLWKRIYLKDLMGVGFDFFVIQIAVLILFSTDNLIISKIFSPKEVVPYNIAYKYFSILTIIYSILLTPYWSAFTEAYQKKEIQWIKTSVNSILKIWLSVPILLILMLIMSNWFYELWIGPGVIISISLSLSMALFVLLFTFNMVFTSFLNGVGKIKLQLITSIISIFINIPLSILFAETFKLGTSGVILATSFSLLIYVIIKPIQYYKIINNKAVGIWNK